jgi:DNA repair exonuclease SbcCD ATPase subunit
MTLKYDESGRPYEDMTDENKKLNHRIKELENSLSIALEINDNYQREKKKLQEEVDKLKADYNDKNI